MSLMIPYKPASQPFELRSNMFAGFVAPQSERMVFLRFSAPSIRASRSSLGIAREGHYYYMSNYA